MTTTQPRADAIMVTVEERQKAVEFRFVAESGEPA
jgi:hypothetical protein